MPEGPGRISHLILSARKSVTAHALNPTTTSSPWPQAQDVLHRYERPAVDFRAMATLSGPVPLVPRLPKRTLVVPATERPKDSMAEFWINGGEITLGYQKWAPAWLAQFRAAMKR